MKTLTLLTSVLLAYFLFVSCAPPEEIVIPYGTTVKCQLYGDITLDDKPGKEVEMKVQNDVLINGKVVISKDSPVKAVIRTNQKPKYNNYTGEEMVGQLVIDIFSTKAVDGTEIKFADTYIQFFAERNGNWFDKKRKWLIGTGTVKNCDTRLSYKVNVP